MIPFNDMKPGSASLLFSRQRNGQMRGDGSGGLDLLDPVVQVHVRDRIQRSMLE
jgi:hypothetical protein